MLMQNYEKELKAMIAEDMERLKQDITDLMQDRKENQFSEYRSGIVCPKCGKVCKNNKESRIRDGFRVRRKVCIYCGRKWQTIEVVY